MRWLASTFAIFSTIALAQGCGESEPNGTNGNSTLTTVLPENKCNVPGSTMECSVELGRHDGIVNCAKGTRTCIGGGWGPCQAETTSAKRYSVPEPPPRVGDPSGAAPGTGGIKGLSINATASSCTDNPCNPYCQKFPDVPDAALTGDSAISYPDRNLTLTELPNGNPPDGFVKKGNDDNGVCGGCYPGAYKPYSASQACQEACQFDSHCAGNGVNGCVSFNDGEKDGCTGIDITAPLVCQIPDGAPNNAGMRKLAVCNRGTTDVPANSEIVCWTFPGGSPQFPENDPLPGANNSAGPIDTFDEEIKAGECITHILDESAFGNSGTVSVMCNVRQSFSSLVFIPGNGVVPADTVGPTTNIPETWQNPTDAYAIGGGAATVTFTPSSAISGPTAPAGVGTWSNATNIGQDADGFSATVTLANNTTATVLPLYGFNMGTLVPAGSTIESITTSIGVARSGGSNNNSRIYAVTKIGATAIATTSPDNNLPAAIAQRTSTYTNSSGTYTQADMSTLSVEVHAEAGGGGGFTGSVDNVSITVTYIPANTSTVTFGGFPGFAVPAGATAVSVTLQANWMANNPNTRLCFQAYDGATAIGTATCTTAGATPSVLTASTVSVGVTVAQANNLTVKVTATHAAGQPSSTATLDYLVAQLKYLTPPQLTGVDECNINNNWTVSKKNPPLYCPAVTTYYDFTTTRVFDGYCPAGTRTRWRLFGWDSATPGASKIEFRFRAYEPTALADGGFTCDSLPAISSSPPSALATAQASPDTQVCSVLSVSNGTCPGDLTTYLGGAPTSDLRCLQMDAHGYADTYVGAPTLNGWTATYDCLPSE